MNTKVWNMYKGSDEGKKLIELFNPEPEDLAANSLSIFQYTQEINQQITEDDFYEHFDHFYFNIFFNAANQKHICSEDISREEFERFVTELDLKCLQFNEDKSSIELSEHQYIRVDDYRSKASLFYAASLAMYYFHGFFKPMLYAYRFDVFQRKCTAVGIDLPPIPRSNNYVEYLLYYYDLCVAINQFQEEQGMTDAELCACIYGCSDLFVDDDEKASELPKPINVWFTGASKEDYEDLERMENADHIWACNERTRRGDIVVIYCKSPHSFIHSIWRASSEGIFNPFDYYHCRTLVSDGIKIPHISYNELKEHPHFSTVPIVRKNLQGLNGIELTSKDYTELLNLIESKGGDISVLPKLFEKSADLDVELKIEKDVEEKLLIPLLDKLGYKHDDWTRQASQKAGRNLKAIPDFVFFPKGEEHFQNAPFLIEAKFDMSSIRELKNAFEQAASYSRMMQCKVMGICDKERLILYKLTSSGAWDQSKPIFENHWEVINNDADVYAALRKIMAPEIIKSL